jgi:hypothetical protein
VRIYEAANDRLVDQLDLSIPAGPTERATGAALTAPYMAPPYPYEPRRVIPTNANTKPGTPSAGAEPTTDNYQLTIIGGFTDGFHFYPIIVSGNTATIQLHHNMLEYGKTYYVMIDAGVLKAAGSEFRGTDDKQSWRFTTKAKGPRADAEKVTVSADGKGDFNTVQGAIDFVPDHSRKRVTIVVRKGIYQEIVYFRNKDNVTFLGDDREQAVVRYANNEVFNPHPVNIRTNELAGTFPSRRAAFAVDNSNDIQICQHDFANHLAGSGRRVADYGTSKHPQQCASDRGWRRPAGKRAGLHRGQHYRRHRRHNSRPRCGFL